MEVSVYHNIIAISNNTNPHIYLYNYEYCKLMSSIKVKGTPSALYFINGFEILLVANTCGKVFIIKFEKKDMKITY
jgi:hypothetical protein